MPSVFGQTANFVGPLGVDNYEENYEQYFCLALTLASFLSPSG
jgi:hypothetical protein